MIVSIYELQDTFTPTIIITIHQVCWTRRQALMFQIKPMVWLDNLLLLLLFPLKVLSLIEDKMNNLYFDIKHTCLFHLKVPFQYSYKHEKNKSSC